MRVFMKACEERNIDFMELKYHIPSIATTREERRNKSDFGSHNLDWIGYADDLVLVFEDTDNLQKGLNTLNETFKRYHLTINVLRVVKALPAFIQNIFSQNLLANQNRGIICIIIPNFTTVE